MPQYMIKKLSIQGFLLLIIGSIVSTAALVLLLFHFDNLKIEQQVTEDTYNSMYELKYLTEQLLTTHSLDKHKIKWLNKNNEFKKMLNKFTSVHGKQTEECIRLFNVIQSEINSIVAQLNNPLFQAKNTMNKSLLRRLGEGLNSDKNSEYYISMNQLRNSIGYIQQYESFLFNELFEFRASHVDKISEKLREIKIVAIILPIIILVLTIFLAFYISRTLGKMEVELLTTHDNLQKRKQKLRYIAYHDSLTGLPNRLMFLDKLDQFIKHTKHSNKKAVVLFIDLDHFKNINDSYGHSLGDELLIAVAQRLQSVIGEEETISRLGGDEFVIILENIEEINDAKIIAKKLIEVFQKPIELNKHIFYITLSIGASVYPDDSNKSEILLRNADSAMYKAKELGRNNYQLYTSDMTERSIERVLMERSLRDALTKDEFEVYYQPQVLAESGEIIGLEALIRWNHPTEGLVSPEKFIPIAEETDLIIPIGEWVLKEVCKQQVLWQKGDINIVRTAVNVAGSQLQYGNLYEKVKIILQETGCNANLIELEVTENFIMRDPIKSSELLHKLNMLGIRISIDDFGTGYSSMTYLKQLPIQKLKIDQAFIKDIVSDHEDAAITRAIIALAKGLDMNVIAEGVEEISQKDFLIKERCNHIQGYLYSKPVPTKEVEKLLKKGTIEIMGERGETF
ncbi:MAG: EAL domain-containing protein [Campylobacterota bacterium]|nr:EAL domain-containing protein [Campylobacterota bacterium]